MLVHARHTVVQGPARVYLHGRMPADPHPTGLVEPVEPGWFWAVGEGFATGVLLGCSQDAATGQVVIAALLAPHGDRLSTAGLRALPLGRLEAVLQREELRRWALASNAPDAPSALEQRLRLGKRHLAGQTGDEPHAVSADPRRARADPPGWPSWHTAAEPVDIEQAQNPDRSPAAAAAGALQRPGSRLTDDFLQAVAAKYRELAQRTHKPTLEIAQEAGVPLTTARRWVGAARQRGFLGPGHRGRSTT